MEDEPVDEAAVAAMVAALTRTARRQQKDFTTWTQLIWTLVGAAAIAALLGIVSR